VKRDDFGLWVKGSGGREFSQKGTKENEGRGLWA
jgi:hypothetical protein